MAPLWHPQDVPQQSPHGVVTWQAQLISDPQETQQRSVSAVPVSGPAEAAITTVPIHFTATGKIPSPARAASPS